MARKHGGDYKKCPSARITCPSEIVEPKAHSDTGGTHITAKSNDLDLFEVCGMSSVGTHHSKANVTQNTGAPQMKTTPSNDYKEARKELAELRMSAEDTRRSREVEPKSHSHPGQTPTTESDIQLDFLELCNIFSK